MSICKDKGHDWDNQGTYSRCKRSNCGKVRRNGAASIRVKRVVSETGELIEQTVPAGSFKTERPTAIAAGFREKVLAGMRPGLIFPGQEECPLEAGQELPLTPNVSIFIYRITKTKGGDHRCRYQVIDMRATLPRRTPPMYEPPETDELGYPIKPTPGAIAAATIDGNYCQGSGQAVPDVAEEVGITYRRVLGTKARSKDAERKRKEQPMTEAEKDAQRAAKELQELVARSVKAGLDPVEILAPVNRAISEAHAGVTQQGKAERSEGETGKVAA